MRSTVLGVGHVPVPASLFTELVVAEQQLPSAGDGRPDAPVARSAVSCVTTVMGATARHGLHQVAPDLIVHLGCEAQGDLGDTGTSIGDYKLHRLAHFPGPTDLNEYRAGAAPRSASGQS
jgi:hypothetical protein